MVLSDISISRHLFQYFLFVNFVLKFHIECFSFFIFIQALSLMSIMAENTNCYSMLPIYNNFLAACYETQTIDYANECMDLMEHQMVGKNEITYAQLLKVRLEIFQQKCYYLVVNV